MIRISGGTGLFALLLLSCTGCAHYLEARAIGQFVDALNQDDFKRLQKSTSREFEQKALRLTAALEDMQILNLPKGDTSVVHVEDVSSHEKNVTVESEGSSRKLLYKLTKDSATNRWVVDDIYLKQKYDGITAVRSVTEQMDLLLTVREFLAAWRHAGRTEILESCAPELRHVLGELPPDYLAYLCKRVAGEHSKNSKYKPEAKLDENLAIVRLPRSSGELLVTFQLHNEIWKIKNISLESKSDNNHIASLIKHAQVLISAVQFLEAYGASNQQALQRLTTNKLGNTLQSADLTSLPLQIDTVPLDQYQVKTIEKRGSVVIPGEQDFIRISLIDQSDDTEIHQETHFVIDDVTLYSIASKEEKRLSVIFQAQSIIRMYSEAMMDRDIDLVRKLSTKEFNTLAWQRIDSNIMDELVRDKFSITIPIVQQMDFQGALAKMTVQQGQDQLTYVLLDRDGQVRVDDILISKPGLPGSFKTLLSTLVPVKIFLRGLEHAQLPLIQRVCSEDFNRGVWRHMQTPPPISRQIAKHMAGSLYHHQISEDSAILKLGSDQSNALVLLKEEHQQWVIDDVVLSAKDRGMEQIRLKEYLREQVSTIGHVGISQQQSVPLTQQAVSQVANEPQQYNQIHSPELKITPFGQQQHSEYGSAPQVYRRDIQ